MRIRISAFLLTAISVLPGCKGQERGVYPVPLAEAFSRLKAADIDGFRMAWQCGILVHFKQEQSNEAILWRVASSGRPVARFTVTLSAAGQGTSATIALPPGEKGGEIYDGQQLYTRPALRQPLRPALQELVDSAMEQRAFDEDRLPPAKRDTVCNAQRGSMESGTRWGVDDETHLDSDKTERKRELKAEERAREERNYGKSMIHPGERY